MPLAPEFVQVPRKELRRSEASKKTKSYPLNFKFLSKDWVSGGSSGWGERESCTSETQQGCCCGDIYVIPAPAEAVRP